MSKLVSKIDKNGLCCIIHCRSNISSEIKEFSSITWEKVANAAKTRNDELCCQGMTRICC